MLSGLLTMALFVWRKTPSHNRNWKIEHSRLPVAAVDGDRVQIQHVRNFRYDAAGRVVRPTYEDRIYSLAELASVWYGISHFGDYGLAHTFLSFGFEDGRYLAVSIEARQEMGETYSPIQGMLRRYELIYVIGDERDIIGLRTHIRQERVYLYPLTLSVETARILFADMLRIADGIRLTPRFYHTITDNCTVGIIRHARQISAFRRFFDYRVLLPGYSDRLGYAYRFIPDDLPLAKLREAVRIHPEGFAVDDPDFYDRIRGR
ncbi:MAG: DUF4105 domain-containing protein [Desulfococcaceae bacterium]